MISSNTIGPFQFAKGERAKLKVKVRLNLHGIVSVESTTLLEEEEIEVHVAKENRGQVYPFVSHFGAGKRTQEAVATSSALECLPLYPGDENHPKKPHVKAWRVPTYSR
ncbi:hypothetical protein Dimus_029586 [Dionaea muscipula]